MRTLERLAEDLKQMHRAYTRIESMLEAVDTVPDLHNADQERIKKYMEHWKEIPKVSMVGT